MGKYHNISKMITASESSWREGAERGLMHIRTGKTDTSKLQTADGHQFVNMVSCSYLGLNRHPKILEGAKQAIEREGVLNHAVSRVRIAPALLGEAEEALATLFESKAYLTPSCFYASATALPLLSSGHLTGGVKPVMVFDKNCHFSMNIMKAVCGDETEVVTIPHNDMNALEDACKAHPAVVYVCDGAYSTGGAAPVRDLLQLQDRYGLFLYVDDSHSVSVCGRRGQGMFRPQIGDLGERTMIAASLAKSFGTVGGVLLFGTQRQRELIDYSAGPLGWSQQVNVPAMGAAKATAELHMTEEVAALQEKMRSNMAYLDSLIPTPYANDGLPIRVIEIGESEHALEVSQRVYRRGFYTSAVFFPIVARGRAGLRIMGRADMEKADLLAFCEAVKESVAEVKAAA
ncbi:aminotransferase class I/II-fold pyridoxal phosphate-dependent enzyme [Myxococcus sp. AB036A]|uniref:aminotransferase class I/II-fold pyridoxal phosphate-dependent enzyme n=1 Tax=Myxococcus sp. AB036A TaxID=2562793 RepID=UPI0011472FE2|nr:aminotransferase class I/II-fold pyridoxal phosphate-dependent enzyme [Myxococcus sp. AB036A]